MIKLRKTFMFIIPIAVFSLVSCEKADDGEFKIAASFAPMYDFTKRIVGDKAEVINIVGDNEPHGFEPNDPKTAAFVEDADLLVAYGHNIDSWAVNMNSSKYFDATTDVTFYSALDQDGNETNTVDPHAWLSLLDAKIMINNIATKVISIDPDNKETYENNLEETLTSFTDLYNEYVHAFESDALYSKIIVTSHEAFRYFAMDFGLVQKGIADIANNEPSSAQITKIIDYIKDNDVHYIFLEELDEPGFVDTIVEELRKDDYDINYEVLNAYEGVKEEDWDSGNDYLSVMESNLLTIKETLGN